MFELFDKLSAPFPPEQITWRVGSTTQDKSKGMALAYIDARDVMDRLDLVCGPNGWQCRYPHANGKTVCEIGINPGVVDHTVRDEWLWKADGAGDTDYEAEKGALSDAFKRAAVRWGVGRYLYSLPSPWVKIVPAGAKSFKVEDGEYPKLRKLLMEYTREIRKSAAEMLRHKDFDHFKDRLAQAADMEELGSIGREIKAALPSLPVSVRDPLSDLYLSRREELQEAAREAANDLHGSYHGVVPMDGSCSV